MAGQGMGGMNTEPLEIRVGGLRRFLVLVGMLVLFFLVPQVLMGGYHRTAAEVGGAGVATLLVGALVRHLRWRRRGCLVRIGEDGITVTGARTVGWNEIREVREVRRAGWLGLVPIAGEGVELPLFRCVLFRVRPGVRLRPARNAAGAVQPPSCCQSETGCGREPGLLQVPQVRGLLVMPRIVSACSGSWWMARVVLAIVVGSEELQGADGEVAEAGHGSGAFPA